MIHLHGRLICTTHEDAQKVRSHLPLHLSMTRAEPGCLLFEVQQTDDPMIWDVKETFRDRASFDAHQERTRNSLWFAATRDIKRDFHLEDSSD